MLFKRVADEICDEMRDEEDNGVRRNDEDDNGGMLNDEDEIKKDGMEMKGGRYDWWGQHDD